MQRTWTAARCVTVKVALLFKFYRCLMSDVSLPSLPPLVATFHIICRQHAGLAGSLHGAIHPALVDGLSVDDDVAVPERNLVMVLSCVVVQCPINTLKTT